MGGSGLIFRPAQPPFLCHRPLEGRMPSQRLRPALPMTRLLWSTLDTRPTVTMQVSNTCGGPQRGRQLSKGRARELSLTPPSPEPAALTEAGRSPCRSPSAAKRRWFLKKHIHSWRRSSSHSLLSGRWLDHLQHVCILPPSLVGPPGCWPASPQEEPPAGTHPPHWPTLQRSQVFTRHLQRFPGKISGGASYLPSSRWPPKF